jgi:hypothetical protein
MKLADDEHLTPLGIWLKRKIITLIKLMRPPDAKQIMAPETRSALEDKSAMDR